MPKVDIDYSNTIFYKIYCKNPSVDDIYIGHTTNFVQRKHTHKQSCLNNKSKNHNCKLYKVIRENDGWKNWNMEIIAFHACEDHYSARKLEQNYFEEYKATLNSIQPLPKPQPITIPKEEKIIRTCESCNVSFSTITQQEIHNKTNKHIKKLKMIYDNMGNTNRIHNKPSKKLPNFSCEKCNFSCSKKSNYNKHFLTAKHKMVHNDTNKMPKNAAAHICDNCGKQYTYHSGLSRHKQKCNIKKIEETNEQNEQQNDELSYKDMFIELMKQNQELQKTVVEQQKQYTETINDMIPKIGSTTNNNTTNNNQFNLNLFLNEKCKDALNITDFMKSLELTMNDLVETGKLGYVDGISRIFVKALKDMDVTERPIHCTDIKRETVYIKDDNKWEKEEDTKLKLKKTIRNIENKNLKMLPKWQEENPECMDMESKKCDEFMELSITALGGQEDKDKSEKKIMKNILKEVIINK